MIETELMKDAPQVFDSGDEPFLAWMRNHPDGFVLNTTPSEDTSYLVFHKSQCRHIAGDTSAQLPGAFTEREYIKVCSHDAADLVAWAQRKRKQALAYKSCETCKPAIEQSVTRLPEEIDPQHAYSEGAVCSMMVNAYERNALARKACLDHYGYACVVCNVDFANVYGIEFEGFIHVHHLVPLSEIKGLYEVDPIRDLRPVCPNCHAVIHHSGETRSIEAVKDMLKG